MPMFKHQAQQQLTALENIAATDGVYVKSLPFGDLRIFKQGLGFEYFWKQQQVDKHRAVGIMQSYGEAPAR